MEGTIISDKSKIIIKNLDTIKDQLVLWQITLKLEMQKQLKFNLIKKLFLIYYMIKIIVFIRKLRLNKLEKKLQIIKK